MKFAISAVLLALQVATAAAAAIQVASRATNVKIMPFGASIVGAPGCWRALLWRDLTNNGITNIDFVGSNKTPDCGFPYDGENEGHAGSLAVDYAANGNFVGWLDAAKPNVIIMHLGTNDVLIGHKPTADIINAYSTLLKQARDSDPRIRFIVSKLIPLDSKKFGADAQNGIIALNNAMDSWAASKTSLRSPVTIVDNFSGFDTATDTSDGEHPNDAGNRKLASKFYGPVSTAVKSLKWGHFE